MISSYAAGENANQCGVQDVHEQEKEDRDAGDPVQNPRPHAVATPIQGANGGCSEREPRCFY